VQQHHQENFHPLGMTILTEVGKARWIEQGTNPDSRGIDALIPAGFAAHARLFHPADNVSGGTPETLVRWSEVAKWAGRTVHPLMDFERIKTPAAGFGIGPAPWKYDPDEELYDVGIALHHGVDLLDLGLDIGPGRLHVELHPILERLGLGHDANQVLRRVHPGVALEFHADEDLVLVLLGRCRRRAKDVARRECQGNDR